MNRQNGNPLLRNLIDLRNQLEEILSNGTAKQDVESSRELYARKKAAIEKQMGKMFDNEGTIKWPVRRRTAKTNLPTRTHDI